MNRRQSLGILGSWVATLAWARHGQATTARAVSLPDLVQRSHRIIRGTPVDSFARAEDVGGARHIVTYSRLRVEELLEGGPSESEILVRSLGGQLAGVGEIVHGEAELALAETSVIFLRTSPDGIEHVTAMAQGYYPLLLGASSGPRLRASRNLPHLVAGAAAGSAVAQLSGVPLDEARSLIRGARR